MSHTQDCNRWCQTSISEQSLAVNFSIGVVGVRVARRPLHSRPFSDGTVPAYDAVKHTAVILKNKTPGQNIYAELIQPAACPISRSFLLGTVITQ